MASQECLAHRCFGMYAAGIRVDHGAVGSWSIVMKTFSSFRAYVGKERGLWFVCVIDALIGVG